MWHWRERRCDFPHPVIWRAGCMTCGPGPPCWTAGCSKAEGAHNHWAVVRFLRGGSPSCPLISAKMKGHITAGRLHAPHAVVHLFDRWLRRKMRGHITAGRLHAPCVAVFFFALRVSLYDTWGLAPCHRVGTPVRIGGDLARDASGHEWGNPPLKRGPSPRQ
jgi:hypothetical protein